MVNLFFFSNPSAHLSRVCGFICEGLDPKLLLTFPSLCNTDPSFTSSVFHLYLKQVDGVTCHTYYNSVLSVRASFGGIKVSDA